MLRRFKKWYCEHIDWHCWSIEADGIRCVSCGTFRTLPNFDRAKMFTAYDDIYNA